MEVCRQRAFLFRMISPYRAFHFELFVSTLQNKVLHPMIAVSIIGNFSCWISSRASSATIYRHTRTSIYVLQFCILTKTRTNFHRICIRLFWRHNKDMNKINVTKGVGEILHLDTVVFYSKLLWFVASIRTRRHGSVHIVVFKYGAL